MGGKSGSFLDGLFLGSLIGGVAALLFTPFTGEEARNKVKEKIDELKAAPEGAAGNIRENSQEVISKTITSIEDGISRLMDAVEEAKKAAEDKRKEMGEE